MKRKRMTHPPARGVTGRSAAGSACRHHWLIEPANGPLASGFCRRCGARREFRTSSDDYISETVAAPAEAR